MIEQYFKKPETWDRLRACWLFPLIERYIVWLTENKYAPRIVYRRVPLLVHFAEYARAHGATAPEALADHVDGFVEEWLQKRGHHAHGDKAQRSVRNAVRGPVEQLVRLMQDDFEWRERKRKPFPFEAEAPDFLDHLVNERGLAAAAVRQHCAYLRHFEHYLTVVGLSKLGDLAPPILAAFITERGQGYVRSSMTALCSSLRVFLRYLYRERIHAKDLSVNVDGPRCYRLAALPRSISWAEVQRMLDCVDRRHRKLWPKLGLHIPAAVARPRLHCLRHSFAVETLLRWYRGGQDPNEKLLMLSTFMGHVHPNSTAVYLTITAELREVASQRFERFAAPLLKEEIS